MLNTTKFILVALMTLAVSAQIVADDVVIKNTSMPLTVLTEAKVHEALIAPESYYNDVPLAVPKAPRANLVEEKPAIPAELEKRAVWIPGYWEWNPDTEGFVWTTGVWRFPPPHHQWVPSQWTRTDDGFVRVRGHWTHDTVQRVVHLSAPPRYRGSFPLANALAKDEFWVPGVWLPAKNGDFTWREGFVSQRFDNYTWVPAQYFWKPNGWVLVNGYWDYPLAARGQAFASLKLNDGQYDADKLRVETFAPVPSDTIKETPACEFVYSLKDIEKDYTFVGIDASTEVPPAPVVVTRVFSESPRATIRGIVHRGPLTPANIDVELIGHDVKSVTTDDTGRFEFSDVPVGVYYVRAVGPVQNHIKRAYGKLTVLEDVAVDLELH